MSRLTVSLMTLVVVAGLAACGSPSADEQRRDVYIAAIDQARSTLRTELQQVDDRAEPTATPASDARTLGAYERAVARVRLDLTKVRVPQAAAAQHRALLTALRRYEVALSRARAAGARTTGTKIALERQQLESAASSASAKVDAAIAALRRTLSGS